MAYRNLSEFIELLRSKDELVTVKEFVSPRLEMAEIADRLVKNQGKAVLFTNNGTGFPVLMNACGTYKRMCMALSVESLEEMGERIGQLFAELSTPRTGFTDKLKLLPSLNMMASWMPKVVKRKGECQEVVMENPDLSRLPVLTCWPYDGGPFITFPLVHTRDPETGIRNLGMYRMQVFDGVRTGMHWHMHKNSARHYQEYKALGRKMPVVVTLGGDPAYTYSATAPLPDHVDEYLLAGFLRKKKVELVKCLTCDLEVPADADFVIEGYVDPMEPLVTEGPFGDHTGYYSLEDLYPVFHVTCITHRKNAIYPATIVGIPPQEDLYLGLATERLFLRPIRMTMLPEIIDMYMPAEGVFHNLVLVKIKKTYPGQAIKVMNALWGAGQMMFNKVMIVVDEHTDLYSVSLMQAIAEHVNPARDVILSRGPVDVLDHSSAAWAFGGKMGIDATRKTNEESGIGKQESTDGGSVGSLSVDSPLSVIRIVAFRKTRAGEVRMRTDEMINKGELQGVKFLVFTEEGVDPTDYPTVIWRVANNIDPQRDCYLVDNTDGKALLVVDGTRKYRDLDGFQRPWPNIIAMDDDTITRIDEKWERLGLGTFLGSPSLKYKAQLYPGGARAAEH